MNKKQLVGAAAIFSSVLSALLWFWYANIPSFDSTDKGFSELSNQTFQEEKIDEK